MSETTFAFRETRSFMHSLDPLSKLVFLLSVSVIMLAVPVYYVQAPIWLVLVLMAVGFSGISLRFLFRFLIFIYCLALFIFVIQSVTVVGGPLLLQLGPVRVYETGLLLGLGIGLRAVNFATSAMVFLVTTSPRDLAATCYEKLRLPAKAIQTVYLSLRFMPLLEEEYRDMVAAHRVRGAGSGRGLATSIDRWKRYTVPFLVSSLRRAQVTALAMDAKAFGAYPEKTWYHKVEYPFRGKVFAAVWVAIAVVIVILAATGHIQSIGRFRIV